ncbi:MAG: hypothetical protein KAH32_01080 [Chlamydiia bacterium]|nr:hypothetical protein [Chlamydiia bacterium]
MNTIKPKSMRQKAFDVLDQNPTINKRPVQIELLTTTLGVKSGYAATLIQHHRTQRSLEGKEGYETIFEIRDYRSNVPVTPYMSQMVKKEPNDNEARTAEDAINTYINKIKLKLEVVTTIANELC